MIKIGDCVTFRSLKTFYDCATTRNGQNYLISTILRHANSTGLILIEVRRVSLRKWQVIEVCTEDNNYCLEDEAIFLTADFYNTKELLSAKPTKWYNTLFGRTNRISSKSRTIKLFKNRRY